VSTSDLTPRAEESGGPGRRTETTKERIMRLLSLCGYALGPAALVNYLGQLFLSHSFSTRYLTVLDILAFLATFVLLLNLPWKTIVSFLPQFLYLVFTLCLLLPFLKYINWWQISPTVKWSRDLISSLPDKCPPSTDSFLSDPCIIQQLGTFDTSSPVKLIDDLRVGETLMSEPRIKDVLDRCYGIKPDFLGTGMSLPDTARGDYTLARAPEYWIKNRQDSDDAVWTWTVQPTSQEMNLPLLKLVEGKKPLVKHGSLTFKTQLEQNNSHLALGDKAPVLVRFGQFPPNKYHNQIGKDNTKLVFVNHFGELANLGLSLADSASYSGRSIRNSDVPNVVFIWVIFSQSNRDAIPATWHTLLAYIAEDLKQVKLPSTCQN
jgi:hypothetical protein